MKEQLECFIRSIVTNPIEEEINDILGIFHERYYDKGEIFKHQDKICTEFGYIVDGSLRLYVVKENGEEMTGSIISKNNLVTDFIGVRTNEKTLISIDAFEPTSMLVASTENNRKLLEVNITYNRFIREHLADRSMQLAKMHMLFLAGSAKERYLFILENNPNLLKKFPLRFIANMIGITPTQLSRIRKKS
ncbi:Crp/Fnr family transcriptional regulator [Flagellimonas sp. S174]|uniref:Crp/Fnr family transcriptional regulator n=1 Tax=Flagellimonas sp. S174 TaxID=3410790 RepID=UPI003BF60C03